MFEKYPLPWTHPVAVSTSAGQFPDATSLIDATGKAIDFTDPRVTSGIKQITENLKQNQRRKMGQRSRTLFVVKNTVTGRYIGGPNIYRCQHFRAKHNANSRMWRMNRGDTTQPWQVFELILSEKS